MKKRDRYLTGILLILIGVLVGTILTMYQQGNWINDQAEVKFTEVKKSERPFYTDEELSNLDPRFLFKQVAEEITPTVVYIETEVSVGRRDMPDDGNHDGDLFDDFMGGRARTVGSGVLISKDGYILTNNHVIDGAVNGGIRVVLNDKRLFRARQVGSDPTTDLAVLKIDGENLPSIIIGNSDNVDVGEWVLAIGNPFRLRSTVTAGIVSALSRQVQVIDNQMRIESFIQTDAAINRGNSGGALVNTSGELIGINTAIASQSGNYQGYGFAVPSNLASKVARDLIQYGEVRRALLGVTIESVDAFRADQLDMNRIQGVEITSLREGAAAYQSGLKIEDVILSVNGIEVNEANELQEKIAVLQPGEVVELEIWREGEVVTKSVKLQLMENEIAQNTTNQLSDPEYERYQDDDSGSGDREVRFFSFDLGFKVMEISSSDENEPTELIISEVERGSEAFMKGLKEGYTIKKVDDEKVEDLESLKDLVSQSLNRSNSIVLHIETNDGAKGFYQLNKN
ncbi:PDZ domain-containing protein [Balneolaceae bacterium YR4-1]|uniref:PDZ domain-containing protein n=1 Tax=Halalkalibaculum roseum TaxID=2709311 RepID=A0A6M1T3U1_9BACT|nr:trypsin-like peptidase domain-containing protein [Halalkalibaculum roseum]NGP76655.1 PDZ domain-containing protein [Halalkalibaculum roseum]